MKTTQDVSSFDTTWYVTETRQVREAELRAETTRLLASIAPGHIYVVEFDTGVVKVGKTTNPKKRIAVHARHGRAHGRTIEAAWVSVPHFGHRHTERELIDFCTQSGQRIAGREFFRISFQVVRNRADLLASNHIPHTADDDLSGTWQDAHERLEEQP